MVKKWQLLEKQAVYESPFITLYKEKLQSGEGKIIPDYYSVKRRDAVFIVALTANNQIPLVYQYKNGVKDLIWEVPAGFIDEGETPEKAASRELLEETGFSSTTVELLGKFVPNTGVADNRNFVFLAKNARKTHDQNLDPHEEIEVKLFDFETLVAAIKKRESIFVDTQSPFSLLLAWEVLNQ